MLALLAAGAAWAQPLTVYSELAEIDATGKVTAPDSPREILSPALVRNGFTSFQVVVQAPAEKNWWLFVGLNPENAVKATMYRESAGVLEPVEIPRQSSGTEVLWMDLWTDRSAPVARIKVEPELMIDDDWVTYPIEGRVMEATVPDGQDPPIPISPVAIIRLYVCPKPGGIAGKGPEPLGTTLVKLRSRNAYQDLALAARAPKSALTELFGSCDTPAPSDPEWYLRIRDYLFRLR